LHEVTRDAVEAVVARNDPEKIFSRAGSLVRLVETDGETRVEPLNTLSARGVLSRVAEWYTIKKDETEVEVFPPNSVAEDILSSPDDWHGIPNLRGVVNAPVLTADGRILVRAGYDDISGLYHAASMDLPPISVDNDSVRQAVRLLQDELFGEFPFNGQDSRANALAMGITPFVRPHIAGPVPVSLIDAPKAGTGKTLLAQVSCYPFAGPSITPMATAKDEEEWRKRLTSVLIAGRNIVLIDNVRGRLDSGTFASAITAYPRWSDRLLGVNREVTPRQDALFIITGNNISLTDEIGRRAVWIRLDAKTERPWQGRRFRHDPIMGWCEENRLELTMAYLTIIQAWLDAGCPAWDGERLGMFEKYCDVVGGILQNAGVEGFLGNATELYENLDPDSATWSNLVDGWWQKYRSEPVGVSSLWGLASENGLLADLVGDAKNEKSEQIRLGKALAQRVDQVYGQVRIVKSGKVNRAAQYKLVQIDALDNIHQTSLDTFTIQQAHDKALPDDEVNVVNVSPTQRYTRPSARDKNQKQLGPYSPHSLTKGSKTSPSGSEPVNVVDSTFTQCDIGEV